MERTSGTLSTGRRRFTSRAARAWSYRDIAKGGAKIRITWPGWLPDTLEFPDSFTQVKREVWVVWREASYVGVWFTADFKCSGSSAEVMRSALGCQSRLAVSKSTILISSAARWPQRDHI